jgi:hypothetical protein
MRRARTGAAAVAALTLLASTAGPTLALLDAWSISASPNKLVRDRSTQVELTVVNRGLLLANPIGCVRVTIPEGFDVSGAAVADLPSGSSWDASVSGGSGASHVVEFRADGDGDALSGGALVGQTGVFSVTVVGQSAGSFTWPARAFAERNCSGGSFANKAPGITVTAPSPTPSPPPTPAPTPPPTPAPTPAPTPTATAPATITKTFKGQLTTRQITKQYTITAGSGPLRASLDSASAVTLALIGPGGSTIAVAQGAGPTLSVNLSRGTYTLVVTGTGVKVGFRLTVTYPSS